MSKRDQIWEKKRQQRQLKLQNSGQDRGNQATQPPLYPNQGNQIQQNNQLGIQSQQQNQFSNQKQPDTLQNYMNVNKQNQRGELQNQNFQNNQINGQNYNNPSNGYVQQQQMAQNSTYGQKPPSSQGQLGQRPGSRQLINNLNLEKNDYGRNSYQKQFEPPSTGGSQRKQWDMNNAQNINSFGNIQNHTLGNQQQQKQYNMPSRQALDMQKDSLEQMMEQRKKQQQQEYNQYLNGQVQDKQRSQQVSRQKDLQFNGNNVGSIPLQQQILQQNQEYSNNQRPIQQKQEYGEFLKQQVNKLLVQQSNQFKKLLFNQKMHFIFCQMRQNKQGEQEPMVSYDNRVGQLQRNMEQNGNDKLQQLGYQQLAQNGNQNYGYKNPNHMFQNYGVSPINQQQQFQLPNQNNFNPTQRQNHSDPKYQQQFQSENSMAAGSQRPNPQQNFNPINQQTQNFSNQKSNNINPQQQQQILYGQNQRYSYNPNFFG
ncbi:hypothetical protein PPERSA_08586 [Pseudocohnilembus persalinus]|uniref:Uncharacterized protein n=1 Tax=Pseudocohnilembus persalinus TaxID=266149 RepID=A0A0V0R1J1_PSEPJ|nr:hypothetical protein PPERSA_08586 [Pseudocohnilembus persalinus]|eukprot:KRX08387.1 hypothetical protein PPERSA_08586 [Pseudocohnilembus persalinus]